MMSFDARLVIIVISSRNVAVENFDVAGLTAADYVRLCFIYGDSVIFLLIFLVGVSWRITVPRLGFDSLLLTTLEALGSSRIGSFGILGRLRWIEEL